MEPTGAGSVEEARPACRAGAEAALDPVDGALDVAPALGRAAGPAGARPPETNPAAWTPSSRTRRRSPGRFRYSSATVRWRSPPRSVAIGVRPRTGERREVREPDLQGHGPRAVAVLAETSAPPSPTAPAAHGGSRPRRPDPGRTSPRARSTSALVRARPAGRRSRGPARPRWLAAASPMRRSRIGSGVLPRSPTVRIAKRPNSSAVFSPTPQSLPTGSGSRKLATSSAGTWSSPSGLQPSEASFATNLRRRDRPPSRSRRPPGRPPSGSSSAIATGEPNRRVAPPTSRNASSREIGSTSGVCASRTSRKRFE